MGRRKEHVGLQPSASIIIFKPQGVGSLSTCIDDFYLFCRLTFNVIYLNSLVPVQYALTQHMDQTPITLISDLLS